MSINKVMLIGNCTKDPEVRYLANGEAVASIGLATNEKWKDKDGNKHEKAEFHNLTFFRRLAEVAGEYLKKGSLIYVEGKITTEKYTAKDGVEKYATKIIVNEMKMLGGKPDGAAERAAEPAPQQVKPADNPAQDGGFDNFDDDIPF